MAAISVFFDFQVDATVPMWMKLNFYRGELDWSADYLYTPLESPFLPLLCFDGEDDEIGISIQLADLTVNPEATREFGIYLPAVLSRIQEQRKASCFSFELEDIRHFIIQLGDLEEVMQLDPRKYYDWR